MYCTDELVPVRVFRILFVTGSQTGLQLQLNIKEYEQVAGLAKLSGVKVKLIFNV